MKKMLFVLMIVFSVVLNAQIFTETHLGALTQFTQFGDYDNDDDLDILSAGTVGTSVLVNIDGQYFDLYLDLPFVFYGIITWNDYDNDNDLDIFVAGNFRNSGVYISKIFRNDSGNFIEINADLTGVNYGSASWGDIDNDGDQDLLLTGESNDRGYVAILYINEDGEFTETNSNFTGVRHSSSEFGDYDNDGDLDIIITGESETQTQVSYIYRNDSGTFIDINANITGVRYGSTEFGDYDNDGDLDIALTGKSVSGYISKIYRNDLGTFTDINANLGGGKEDISWGDYDNDGDLDLLIGGYTHNYPDPDVISKVYENNNNQFTDLNIDFEVGELQSCSWGDYDNDSDLDILISYSSHANLYINNSNAENILPSTPYLHSPVIEGNDVTFSWDKAFDTETPQNGLSYNLYISTQNMSSFIKSPMSNIETGFRKVVSIGNVGNNTSWTINNLPDGVYNWWVQTVDYVYSGSVIGSGHVFCKGQFADVSHEIIPVKNGSMNFGDYDNDCDLDLSISGESSTGIITNIYSNNDGVFSNINADILGVKNSSMSFGDFNNDSDLDLVITGETELLEKTTKIYKNDSGVFSEIDSEITGISNGAAKWGDYDNDGDADLIITGSSDGGIIKRIYNNSLGRFIDSGVLTGTSIYPLINWAVEFLDWDNDNDLDFVLSSFAGITCYTRIFINQDNNYSLGQSLPRFEEGTSIDIGDYNNDGDTDIILSGYKHDGLFESFLIANGLVGELRIRLITRYENLGADKTSSSEFFDYDNDGNLDIIISLGGSIRVFHNNGDDSFTRIDFCFPEFKTCDIKCCDFNKDGMTDIFILGTDMQDNEVLKIYKNKNSKTNMNPNVPNNLMSSLNGNDVTLSWDKATDNETPQDGLSYNLYISSEPGQVNVKSPMSDISTGYRKVVELGNAGQSTSWTIKDLPYGIYYWSVQAVDHAFSGSAFAEEEIFEIESSTPAPSAIDATYITTNSFIANWLQVDNAIGYRIDVDDDKDFLSPLPNYNDLYVGNVSSIEVVNLTPNTTLWYRIRSCFEDNVISSNSNVVSVNTYTFLQTGSVEAGSDIVSLAEFGDYDNDNDLDILIVNISGSKIYRNDTGQFVDINSDLPGVNNSSVAWGDYDNDGDLDFILTGHTTSSRIISKIYRNDGDDVFTDINAGITGVSNGTSAWGDYDNDGDLDLVITGYTNESTTISKIYRNDGDNEFTDINAEIIGWSNGTTKFGDYDNDGDLDLLFSGSAGGIYDSKLYRNDGSGVFTDINLEINTSTASTIDWGDYDNDGDLDILSVGEIQTVIIRNDANGVFTKIFTNLPSLFEGKGCWGDYDNDGDLDISLTGYNHLMIPVNLICWNESGTFVAQNEGIEHRYNNKSAEWGDYDNDGDLDLVYASYNVLFYRNETVRANSSPLQPTGLASSLNNNDVTFSWDKATDNETPQDGLSYNLYIGTEPQTADVNSSMSDISTGFRKVVERGNVGQNNSWTIKDIPDGIYYWSVQAIDHAFAGSEFGGENIFVKGNYTLPDDVTITLGENCRLIVLQNADFTVNAGAVFQMGQGAEIIVSGNGSLKADGVSLGYAGAEGGKWLGINCKAESSVDFNNVHITNAVTGVRGFYNHKFEVTNCIMENCDNGIETIELASDVYYNITGNTLTGTKSGTGVSIFGSNGKFRDNIITYFYVGANFTSCSPEIAKNTIEFNKAYGILISGQNSIPQLINTDLNQVYNELNNTIANNGNTTLGTLIFPSSQIGIRPYSSVYMQNGHNNVYRGEFNIPPAVPCISIENKVSSMTSIVINAQNNYWGSYDVTDEYFDGHAQYTLIYEPYSTNIYTTGGSEPSNSQTVQTPENNILTNAMRMEAEEKYRAAINLYELVIQKYEDTPEYYVAMARLPYLYSLLEEGGGKLISLYDQAYESQNTTNKKFFKSMKVETYIRTNKLEDAITVAEEMKADAESEEEIILADINITIAKLLMNRKGKNEEEVNDLRTLIANLMESEDKVYTEVYENVLPQTHKLYQNYPNPFNPVTHIKYDLSKTANVKLSVYNIYGQLISVLANGKKHAGCHTIEFNGSNINSGIYYYTLEIDGLVITKKMALIK